MYIHVYRCIHGDANNKCTLNVVLATRKFFKLHVLCTCMYTQIKEFPARVSPVKEGPGRSGCASLFLLHARHSPPTSVQSVIARRVSGGDLGSVSP